MISYENIGITTLSMVMEIQFFKKLNIVYRADYGTLCVSGYHNNKDILYTPRTDDQSKKLRMTIFSLS